MSRNLIAAAVAILSAVFAADVFAQGDEIAGILGEITQLSDELERGIPQKIEDNLSLKRQHEFEGQVLKQEEQNLLTVQANVQREESYVISVCDVTVPQEQYAAAVARCNAVKEPYQHRVDQYNEDVDELNRKVTNLNEQEQLRVQAAQEILHHRDQVIDRLRALQAAFKAAKVKACTKSCASYGSNAAAAQCLQICFDGASPEALPDVSAYTQPPFSASENRTPEQAIDEYRRSGPANPGANTLHSRPVPPPPIQ